MTNVVQLRRPEPAPHYLLLETLIDPNRPLEEGDLVALQFIKRGVPGEVMFLRWWGPTGRDCHGRFVKKGSADEYYELDVMKYCVKDLVPNERGTSLKILGRVYGARGPVERITPTAS